MTLIIAGQGPLEGTQRLAAPHGQHQTDPTVQPRRRAKRREMGSLEMLRRASKTDLIVHDCLVSLSNF